MLAVPADIYSERTANGPARRVLAGKIGFVPEIFYVAVLLALHLLLQQRIYR
jgi:hypothetical protein